MKTKQFHRARGASPKLEPDTLEGFLDQAREFVLRDRPDIVRVQTDEFTFMWTSPAESKRRRAIETAANKKGAKR